MVEPVTPLTLLIHVPAFLAMLALFGNPFRIFFERRLNRAVVLDDVERIVLTLGSGAAVMPLIVMVLTWLGNLLNAFIVQVLIIPFAVLNLYLYGKHLRAFRSRFTMPDTKTIMIVLVFLMIFILHLYPSLGIYVHPGDDPKLYSLITLRIVENNGYTTSWGSYALSSWYEEKTHLTIAGFAGTCAFFHLLTGLSIEKTVLLLTLTYISLISLGVYFLAKRLFKSFKIALSSAFVFGMLIREPNIGWFGWGGHAELSSLFLLPIVIGLFWEIFHNNYISFNYFFYLAFLTSGMFLLHPFSVFYLAFALIPYFLIVILKRRELTPVVKSLAVFPISALFVLPVLITAIGPEIAISHQYASSEFPKVWTPMISWNQTPHQLLYNITSRLLAVYGIGTFFLLLICIDLLKSAKIDREPLIFLLAWALTTFLVHENNPKGLYVIPFPFWYRINPNRTFATTSFTISIIIGLGLFKVLLPIENFFSRKEKLILILRDIGRKISSKKTLWTVLLLCSLQISLNVIQNTISLESIPVTEADISAFNWIKYNTDLNATFFVSKADAGQWIPIYTKRRILIPFGVVTNHSFYNSFHEVYLPSFVEDPHSLKVLRFFNYYNVSHVYIGSVTIRNRKQFDYSLLANSPVFKGIYNSSNVWIFKYLGATTITLFRDDDFLSGWNIGGPEGTTDANTDGGILKLGATSGSYVYSTYDLSLNNTECILYLIVKWRTDDTAKYKVQLNTNGNSYIVIDKQASNTWTTSILNLNKYMVGKITSVSIIVEGDGYAYTDFISFEQLAPLKR